MAKGKFPKWATTVTPLSKYLAMVLFILFPFIGFYLGLVVGENRLSTTLPPTQPATGPTQMPTQQVINSREYNDPDGYFQIYIPKDWTATSGHSSVMTADIPPRIKSKLEAITFNGPNNIRIHIDVKEVSPTCNYPAWENNFRSPLAGLLAFYFPDHGEWELESTNASFGILYSYPGAPLVNPGGPMIRAGQKPEITSIPQSVINEDQRTVDAIISTFHPKNSNSLVCPR